MQDTEADRNLARRAAAGDESAWRSLYDATADRLFSLLAYQVGDRDEALDLLQETFVRAWTHLGSYRGDAPLAQWLRRIAWHLAMDWKRSALKRIKRSVELHESTAWVGPDTGHVRFASERAALNRALAKLSGHQRAALLLREWDGLDYREIAAILRCKESTVRVHHTRARERMQGLLGESGLPVAEGLKGQLS